MKTRKNYIKKFTFYVLSIAAVIHFVACTAKTHVPASKADPLPKHHQSLADNIVDTAIGYLGRPYLYGGNGNPAFDCSGLVVNVYKKYYINLPRVSRQQAKSGIGVKPSKMKKGDLVFFSSYPGSKKVTHAGIAISNVEFIHATRYKGEVTIDNLLDRYFRLRLVAVRRVLHLADNSKKIKKSTINSSKASLKKQSKSSNSFFNTNISYVNPKHIGSTIIKSGPQPISRRRNVVGIDILPQWSKDNTVLIFTPYFDLLVTNLPLPIKFELGLPVAIHSNNKTGSYFETKKFNEPLDYLSPIQKLKIGFYDDNLQLELNRFSSATMGTGQLLRRYSANIAHNFQPGYSLENDSLSGAFTIKHSNISINAFTNNILSPSIVAVHGYIRPFYFNKVSLNPIKTIKIGATYIVDFDAHYQGYKIGSIMNQVHGFGAYILSQIVKKKGLKGELYIDGSTLKFSDSGGLGLTLGTSWQLGLQAKDLHVFLLKLEVRTYDGSYIPSYFNESYELRKHNIREIKIENSSYAYSKARILELQGNNKRRNGFYSEFNYKVKSRYNIGMSYERSYTDNLPLNPQFWDGNNFTLFLSGRYIRIPTTRKFIWFHLSIVKPALKNEKEIFSFRDGIDYIMLNATINLNRYTNIVTVIRSVPENGKSSFGFDLGAGFKIHF